MKNTNCKNRNEIIEYVNICEKCFCAFVNKKDELEVCAIKFKKVEKDRMIVGVKKSEKKIMEHSKNSQIAVVIWNKLEGYQFKGTIINQKENKKYQKEIEIDYENLKEQKKDYMDISLMIFKINDIYNVTPGHKG